MPLIDGLVVIGAAGIILLGIFGIRAVRRRIRPEIVGAENAQAVMARGLRRCHFCGKHTDGRVDVFANEVWYHYACFLNQADEDKTK